MVVIGAMPTSMPSQSCALFLIDAQQRHVVLARHVGSKWAPGRRGVRMLATSPASQAAAKQRSACWPVVSGTTR